MTSKKKYYIKSVIKSLNILNLFSKSRQELSISEISKALSLGISTTYRLVGTLKYKNYIEQNPHNLKYKLGCKFLNKAFIISNDEANIIKKSMPYLEKLRDFTKESISLAVLDGISIVYVAKADSYETLRTNIEIGKKLPAYKTALGKVLLAYLSPDKFNRLFKVNKDKNFINDNYSDLNISELKQCLKKARDEGIAFDNEEATIGIRCMAVPITDLNGEVSTAMSISGPTMRFTLEKIDLWKRELIKVAKKISFKST
ncbi:MAG: IclR family transcriptional regulator [Candidatus Caldatribacteriota bacterium]|nr:IclR family transcriptional regulator [Candidatus Caldatribacteriota bacterium]